MPGGGKAAVRDSAVLGVVLAGGQARRMGGGDKCRLSLGSDTILDRVLARLAPHCRALALNANGPAARFADTGLPVLPDSMADHPGPLAGVLAGLDHAQTLGTPWVVTAAGDTPFLPEDLVPRLLETAEAGQPAIAMAEGPDGAGGWTRHPVFAAWPAALAGDLRAALAAGTRKVIAWSDRHPLRAVRFTTDGPDPFFNVNTPDDLAAARARAAAITP